MSVETFKGKLLEEVLAYLIRNAGYQLLVDPVQDPDELAQRGAGLVVKGRGSTHQADVLGQLGWIPAFTFPIRLFVEAKWHRRSKTGLRDVRNAVGVLQDVNQNYVTQNDQDRSILVRRFNYCYSLFSTTGFSKPAEQMALAHLISLIDLSGPEFRDLRELVDEFGDLFYAMYEDEPDILDEAESEGE
jgi:hypothetical protein